jgi:hypothetical protein
MASFVKYENFIQVLVNKEVDLFGTTDTVKAAIHSDAPVVATDTTLSNLTQVTGTGYTAGGIDIDNDATRSGGTVTMVAGLDPVWTAGAGDWTAGRYVSIYDDTPTTPTADPLIGSWDYASSFTLGNGETFTLDFGASVATFA